MMAAAEEKKIDETILKYEDIINVELELEKRRQMIEIALSDIDDTWTKHDTGNENISVASKQFPDSDVGLVRSTTTLKGAYFKNWYLTQECGYDDRAIHAIADDDNQFTELYIRKMIDTDHQITYLSSDPPSSVIAPRDMVNIKTRFKQTNVSFNGKRYRTIMGDLSYSPPENHPFNVAVKQGHVRATVILNGHVLYQPQGFDEDTFKVCKILQMDPNGDIPKWIVNSFAPKEGMKIQRFESYYKVAMQEMMKKREENNWKRQHEPMFEPHPKLMYQEKDASEAEKKEFVNEISDEMKLLSTEYTFKKYTFRSRIICLDEDFDDIIFPLPKDNAELLAHIKAVVTEGEEKGKDVKIIVATITKNDEETEVVLGAKID